MNCEAGSFADPPNFDPGTKDDEGNILVSDFALQVPSFEISLMFSKVRRRAGSAISVISYECSEQIVSAGLLSILCSTVNGDVLPRRS